jgi:hypothetical protein
LREFVSTVPSPRVHERGNHSQQPDSPMVRGDVLGYCHALVVFIIGPATLIQLDTPLEYSKYKRHQH